MDAGVVVRHESVLGLRSCEHEHLNVYAVQDSLLMHAGISSNDLCCSSLAHGSPFLLALPLSRSNMFFFLLTSVHLGPSHFRY